MADTAIDSPGARLRAWGVHLYTGSGAVLALLALDAVGRDAFGAATCRCELADVMKRLIALRDRVRKAR